MQTLSWNLFIRRYIYPKLNNLTVSAVPTHSLACGHWHSKVENPDRGFSEQQVPNLMSYKHLTRAGLTGAHPTALPQGSQHALGRWCHLLAGASSCLLQMLPQLPEPPLFTSQLIAENCHFIRNPPPTLKKKKEQFRGWEVKAKDIYIPYLKCYNLSTETRHNKIPVSLASNFSDFNVHTHHLRSWSAGRADVLHLLQSPR